MTRVVTVVVLAMLAGCMFSRVKPYYRPEGTGKIAVDSRQMPRTMEYGFGTGSLLAVSTERKLRKTEIIFALRLKDATRFAATSGHILFECDGKTIPLPVPDWVEKKIKKDKAEVAEHAWSDALDATGEYRASMILRECRDLPFSFTLPTARVADTDHEFGRVSMTPQSMPLTYTLPVPTRVEGQPGQN